jgi:hypothetical protein
VELPPDEAVDTQQDGSEIPSMENLNMEEDQTDSKS